MLVHLDADDPANATRWIDDLTEAAAHDIGPEGLVAAHFHVDTSGRSILNVAERVSASHHADTLRHRDPDRRVVQVVDTTPGMFDHWERFSAWTRFTDRDGRATEA